MITGIDIPTVFDSAVRDQVAEKIQYSIVSAGTGAGKTTTYPGKLVKAGVKLFGRNYKVLVVLPTKEAVDNAYMRASTDKLNYVKVDFSVGRARDGDVQYSNYKGSLIANSVTGFSLPIGGEDDTELVFCTTGHAKNRIEEWFKYLAGEDYISPRTINVFDFVVVDEAHLRNKNIDIDMILGYLKFLQVAFPKKGVPQVVLTSATYKEEGVPIFNIKDTHPYTKKEECLAIPGSTYEEKVMGLGVGLYQYITISQSAIQPGIILLFLPTARDIKIVRKSVEAFDQGRGAFECFTLHSKIPKEERALAFTPNTPGKWKLILSTNIAETSLTIPNVLIVFNFPYENIRDIGANQTVKTKVQLIAKDSAAQRAGRTGRTNNGYVFHLLHPNEYERLEDTIKPEIERLPISNELLKVLDCNIDYRFIFGDINKGTMRTLSETQSIRINKTLGELSHFGLVKNCNGHYSVTPNGNFIADLPLSNKCGLIVLKAIERKIDVYPAIVLACMIESADTLFMAGQIPLDFQSDIPFSTILKPWLMFCLKFGTISIPGNRLERLMEFCEKNSINYDTFRETQKKVISCVTIIRKKGYDVDIDVFEPEDCFVKMKDILSTIYFHYKSKKNENRIVYISTNERIKHKPLILSDKFVKYKVHPSVVVSVFNIEKDGNTQMMLWFPVVYDPSDNFKKGFKSQEIDRLEFATDVEIIDETPEELEQELEEAEEPLNSMSDII